MVGKKAIYAGTKPYMQAQRPHMQAQSPISQAQRLNLQAPQPISTQCYLGTQQRHWHTNVPLVKLQQLLWVGIAWRAIIKSTKCWVWTPVSCVQNVSNGDCFVSGRRRRGSSHWMSLENWNIYASFLEILHPVGNSVSGLCGLIHDKNNGFETSFPFRRKL